MACGLSNGHVTDDVTPILFLAVRSAILATAWLLVYFPSNVNCDWTEHVFWLCYMQLCPKSNCNCK